jgi:hypothetical protein
MEPAKTLLTRALGPGARNLRHGLCEFENSVNRFGNRNNLGEVLALAL